jgi:VanZ family protein
MLSKYYKGLFWACYFSIIISALIPISGDLTKIRLGPESFRIRLDHLVHFIVYFLICMYYLAGQIKDLHLFSSNSLTKFIVFLLFLALVTELAQLWVPERAFNPVDLLSNMIGVVIGVGVIVMAKRHEGLTA